MLVIVTAPEFNFWLKYAAKRRPVIARNCDSIPVAELKNYRCYLHRDQTFSQYTQFEAGFVLTNDGTLRNLWSLHPKCGFGLMEEAVARGARKLECYDVPHLLGLYHTFGFVETNRVENWQGPCYPDVIYMVRPMPRDKRTNTAEDRLTMEPLPKWDGDNE
jgi:hypothetical protein